MQFTAIIVDDQPSSTTVLTTLLERRGFKCYHAATTEEATKLLEEVLPHLLVVDIHLGPESNGLAWLTKIRGSKYGFIPAVMLTGSSDEGTVRGSLELGIYDYVIKPSRPAILEKKITLWRERLSTSMTYSWDAEQEPLEVEASFEMKIAAISETGLCVDGCISSTEPISFTKLSSSLFGQIELAQPQKITFLNNEKRPGGPGPFSIRNFCQVSGWMEPDFKRIRLWIRSNYLGRSF